MRIGIIGGSGYTGVELLRLLAPRDDVEVVFVSSRAQAGNRVDALFPNLRGFCDIVFSDPADVSDVDCDLVFFATPHGTAMHQASELLARGIKIVDLSADFRLQDIGIWEQWYGVQHACPELVAEATYGLPEVHRAAIKEASLVANPGCYPTTVQLGFLPLLEAGLVNAETLIADAKSGITGAGRGASVPKLLAEASDSFKAYAVAGHRHLPEIEQGLSAMTRRTVDLTFTPHLLPIIRGIHATLYAELDEAHRHMTVDDLQTLFTDRFADEAFVDVMPQGSHPETRFVRGSNMCRLAVHKPQNRHRVVVLAVEDNLVKGAAGQAVQNMNLMLGYPETAGLELPAMLP